MLESFFLNKIFYDGTFSCTESSGNSDNYHLLTIKE